MDSYAQVLKDDPAVEHNKDRKRPTKKQKTNDDKNHKTVLQMHVAYFDRDDDGVIWPLDTYNGMRKWHWNPLLSLVSVLFIHLALAWPTQLNSPLPFSIPLPDPFFRVYVAGIQRAIHGSTSAAYSPSGSFVPTNFDSIFEQYSSLPERDGLTLKDTFQMLNDKRCIMDFFGWTATAFEWIATWLLLWPSSDKGGLRRGAIQKSDIKGIFDGSIFWKMAGEKAPA